ncbi:MAG: peptidylprolyl isomerase [Oscillospiraceae bacterium]|nr:peptidylprolyl isomerase [Oscillospiraceae bacterium]
MNWIKAIQKTVFLAVLIALVLTLGACGKTQTAQSAQPAAESAEAAVEPFTKVRHAEITVKDYGTIKLELDEGTAPITVENFIKLAKDGFYDGLTFHRIMDGFMIQGGDPLGNGTGGSKDKIKGEFTSNGVRNPISHKKGVISMARANDPNSASSQFFITVADSTFLDGSYAAFGRVTEGQEIADKIAKDAKPVDNNGTIPASAQPVIEKITITD